MSPPVMTEEQDSAEQDPPVGDTQPCLPCRGSGKVISHLGGQASTINCPWCLGSGVRSVGMDAQAAWADNVEPQSNDTDDAPADEK